MSVSKKLFENMVYNVDEIEREKVNTAFLNMNRGEDIHE